MRDLEFRAWDGKKMIDDVIPASETSIVELFEYEWQETEVKAVEQYTGLKDKNGQKIYEGDIVLDCYDEDDAFIVEWDEDTDSFILTDTEHISNISFDILYPDKDLEVIGNFYENAELIGEEK